MSTKVPLVPIDPTKVGPVDLAREFARRGSRFVDKNSTELIGGATLIVIATIAAHVMTPWEFTVPGVPNILVVGFVLMVVLGLPSWFTGKYLAAGLRYNDTILVSQQDPMTGDQQLVELQPDTFRDMRVFTHNGDERERSYLHEVVINGRRAYEVDVYHEGENAAVASWQAGVPNTALRQDRKRIKKIKTTLEKEADKALEALTNHVEHVRTSTQEVSMSMIAQVEEVELPGDHSLHERLTERMDEVDMSEALLGIPEDSDGRAVLDDLDGDVPDRNLDEHGSADADDADEDVVEVEITDGGEEP